MILKQKIKTLQLEIENYEWQFNAIPFYPLPNKLRELITLLNPDNKGNADFILYVNEMSINKIKWSIEECNNGHGKDGWWIKFTLNRQIKPWVKSAVYNFFQACEYYNVNI